MGLRSGTHTTGAQLLASLAKSSEAMRKWLSTWDIHQKAADATKDRLTRKLAVEPDIRAMIDEILEGKREVQNNNLSLTQACEKAERRRVLEQGPTTKNFGWSPTDGQGVHGSGQHL